MSVQYTDPTLVQDTRLDATCPPNPYAMGYGPKIPTPHWIKYLNRWRRVWVMCFSNAGTAYIVVKGQNLVIDPDTEYSLRGEVS